jgi:DNA primase
MARIPEVELERLKREADLAALVRASGVELTRRGRDLVGLCPFHADTDPSLVLSRAADGRQLWHCLGACGAGGTVIDWVMRREGVSFRHAVERLLASEGRGLPKLEELDLDPETSDAELLGRVAGFYHETLLAAPEGVAYLERRGLAGPELIARFRLGLANRKLGYRLPSKRLKRGERIRSRLQELGVLRKSGHEHLAGSLVVPITDEAGRVVQLYGRKVTAGLRKGTPLHLYLPGPHRGVWNREALEEDGELILCESLLDAMTFWCAGYRNVTTAYGTNGFTAELHEALRTHARRVLIAFDRDDAGERAAKKVAGQLTADGVECYRVLFPREMDANAYALEVRPAAKSLGVVIRAAEWMGSGPAPEKVSERAAESGSLSEGDARGIDDAPGPLPSSAASRSAPEPSELPEESPASPVPPASVAPLVRLDVREREAWAELGGRCYRVRGLERNTSAEVLRVNLLVRREAAVHVDTLDLYQARQRTAFVAAAASELGVSRNVLTQDLGRLLLSLERHREEQASSSDQDDAPKLSEAETREALELLRDPRLLERILADFERAGLVGEETNKLVGYLAAVSRKLEEPLAVIVQSSSAAGKTSLMDAVLAFVPAEERVQYSALTGQSLFYMQDKNLAHKILAVVEEEGAERASYALKLLQSEGELTIASTGKDPETGKLVTHEYRVEGPVMIILTTTAVEIDEELLNRAIVLAVDEDRAQTRRVHRVQREKRTLEGLLARRANDDLVHLHQNAQRLLRPLAVVNPYAPRLTFLDTRTRTRRDHEKYLTLIDAVALLHQHQREVHTIERAGGVIEYVEVEPSDIEIANRLAGEVLGRSLDELPPQTRRVLSLLDAWVTRSCQELGCERGAFRFTTREVRDALELGQTQAKIHLARLVELEYLLLHRAVSGRPHVYELVYSGEGADGRAFLPGLLDPTELASSEYDKKRSGQTTHRSGLNAERSGRGRPLAGPRSGGGRTATRVQNPADENGSGHLPTDSEQLKYLEECAESYEQYPVAGRNGIAPLAR